MNTDDKIIAILRDTIERCEADSTSPQTKYQVATLAALTLTLGTLTLYYSHHNLRLESEITELQAKHLEQQTHQLPHYQRVLRDSFIFKPKPFQCNFGLTQTLGDIPICMELI